MERIKLTLILIIITIFYSCNGNKNNNITINYIEYNKLKDDALLTFLNNDKRIYINKECSSFFKTPLYKNYTRIKKMDDPPGLLNEIQLFYNDSIHITILFTKNYFSSSRKWDFDKIKSLKIKQIDIYNKDQILQSTREK